MDATSFCSSCHTAFALAEERVVKDGKAYHKHCANKDARRDRIKELFLRNAAAHGLQVVPRHSFGK